MAHTHSHHSHSAIGNIRVAFFLNFFFAIIELVGGLYTNSVAILSDALHDFGDSVSLGLAWYLQKVAAKGRDRYNSYGYKRFSLLGALFISVVLLAGSVIVIIESAKRIVHPQEPDAHGMFLLAILGIVVNGAAILRLKRGSSLNERAVSLHLMEDVLGWIAVLVVSIVMMFVNVPVLDPLLSIGISIWILTNVYRNLRDTFRVFLQQVPRQIDLDTLEHHIRALKDVVSVHDVHLWTLDGEEHVITLHVVTSANTSLVRWQELKTEIRRLCQEAGIGHATIEIENENEKCGLSSC
ncbi:MAG: cation diffusion facilitator family transporter [Parabacteroides sp.]|nr:cation diffusion facilitator family transporter [Parabacteroides sp.]